MLEFCKGLDWDDLRIKAWHLGLTLAAAYCANSPKWGWAVPALTMAASQSRAPFDKGVV